MTLEGYAAWRRQALRAPRRDPEEARLLLEELTSAALTARRCGVQPTLSDLSTSILAEAAWERAGKLWHAEQEWHRSGIDPDDAPEVLHRAQDEHAREQIRRRRASAPYARGGA